MKTERGGFCVKIKSKKGHLAPYRILPNLDISTSGRNSFPLVLPPLGGLVAPKIPSAMLCSRAFANIVNAYKQKHSQRVVLIRVARALMVWSDMAQGQVRYTKAYKRELSILHSTLNMPAEICLSLTGIPTTKTLVALQRVVPGERRAAVAHDRLAIMPGGRLQVSHRVALPMKRLVAPPDPTLPQLHVDLLYALHLPAHASADWPRVRAASHLRYAGGWAGGSGASLGPALPFRVGLVRALDHRIGVPGGGARRNLRLLDHSIMCSALR